MNAALLRNLDAVKETIASLVPLTQVEAALDRLVADLHGVDEYEAELSLGFRIDIVCQQFRAQPAPSRARQQWNELFRQPVHRWRHERHGQTEIIDLSPVADSETLLLVDADFYDRKMAGGRMTLFVRDGEVLTGDGQRLANLIVSEKEDFYSVQTRPSVKGVIDLRRANLLVKKTDEQKFDEISSMNREVKNLAGALGKRGGMTEDEAVAALLQTKGGVTTMDDGHLRPIDDYKVPVFEVGGKKVHQAFNIDTLTTDPLPAKPTAPKGRYGQNGDMVELVSRAVSNPRTTATGAEVKTRVSHGQGMKADNRPIENDVQAVPPVRLEPPKRRCKPKTLTGAMGITRSGGIERSTPPWASRWEES